jgi:hypothetical protein
MISKKILKYCIASLLLATNCVEPFDLPVRNEDVGFLVVDGYINTSTHTATVALSRAIPLASIARAPKETNAIVSIEDDSGRTYPLTLQINGTYEVINSDFTDNKQYRLHILTASGKNYFSEFIITQSAPVIDSVSWEPSPEGITILLDTRDLSEQTKYYRWEYVEAWQYEAALSSEYKLVNGMPVGRSESEQLKRCFGSELSSKIVTETSSTFIDGQLIDKEIAFVPLFSQKILLHYSILVRQYALSSEAYDYWQQLSVNTESLGGLFDPQPSQLTGNIKNVDNKNEPVIGYFDGGSVSEKRIFVKYQDLPEYLQRTPPSVCLEESIIPSRVHELGNFYLITNAVYVGPALVAYEYTTTECADCTRQQGGTTARPDFWPN